MNYYLAVLFWFHLMGIAIWVGGSMLLPLVIMPVVQQLDPPARSKFMAAWSKMFTPWVFGAIIVVVITGLLQTGTIFGTYTIFMRVNVLTVKVFVAVLMIANGIYLGVVLARRALRLAPTPGSPPSPEFLKTQRLLGVHGWVQAGLSVIILLIVGLLTAA